ncbi:DNA helicase [Oricola cellulosilytica]|uniref:DNA helicase n=1 Tax=Oricola cellulosilytica TaxID=1429082 RepID=A0A4R0PG69_9HYPH|nr:DNA helicase [Oricola cellulosilytica]TCD15864.1 DNA helicase [Oricola cellulosilytica]
MNLSAPIHALKREAKALSRRQNIPLTKALDRIARRFAAWSLLMAKMAAVPDPEKLHAALQPGDLLLLGARPRQGKTLMSLRLAAHAMKIGRKAFFFTLDFTKTEVVEHFGLIGEDEARFGSRFAADCSDAISAGYIVTRLGDAPRGALVVIDYLQLLDQRRENPPLSEQVATLRAFARERAITIVFLSQIDRSFDPELKPVPGREDVRLPNPLDLDLFDKACFLHGGEVRLGT